MMSSCSCGSVGVSASSSQPKSHACTVMALPGGPPPRKGATSTSSLSSSVWMRSIDARVEPRLVMMLGRNTNGERSTENSDKAVKA